METVSISCCSDYEPSRVREALNSLLIPLGGIESFVLPGDRVLLKPNMLSAKTPEAAVTTHPEIVLAVAEQIRAVGGIVMIGDSPGIGPFRKVAERSGVLIGELVPKRLGQLNPEAIARGGADCRKRR